MLWEAGGKAAAANKLIQSFRVPGVSCGPSEVFCESFLLLACLLRAWVVLLSPPTFLLTVDVLQCILFSPG